MGLNGGHPSKVLECLYRKAGSQLDSQFCPLPAGRRPSSLPGCSLKGADCRLHHHHPMDEDPWDRDSIPSPHVAGAEIQPGVLSGLGLNLGLSFHPNGRG